ncbi:MAG TPA: DUF512 domain-containing protein [Nitrospirota bacterium]|nr:DUF512 domain-containing protein [Nitrospirota bacterium]
MKAVKGLKVAGVLEGGTASEIGIGKGDEILRIGGSDVPDYLCYRYLIASEEVTLLVKKKDGGLVEIELEKDEDDDLGIVPPPMRVHRCNNKCVFCFVSQMPPGLRKTLYVKDEDYRHSFLYGNYVTLTTLTDEDYARIVRERLSPLYVSVHATDDETRRFLLGNQKAPEIMPALKRLVEGGIQIHAQAVISPGMNDGEMLIKTAEDLASLHPGVASLAVVPVGLTRHRHTLYPLKGFTPAGAARLLDGLEPLRKKYRRKFKESFAYPSDEFYIKAGRDFPPEREYDGYPQMDNGVGLVRDFLTEFGKEKKTSTFSLRKEKVAKRNDVKKIILVTGISFAPYLAQTAKELEEKTGLNLKVLPVKNELFGHNVTVAGLLSGKDIARALKKEKADAALVPSVAVRDGDGIFLDDLTPQDVERLSGVKVVMVEPTARGLVEAL